MSDFLVLESGATKLQWLRANKTEVIQRGALPGLHPFLSNDTNWQTALATLANQLSLSEAIPAYYYGTGCGQAAGCEIVRQQLLQFSPLLSPLSVTTDLLAAARALCQQNPGVICILGTGSNAAYYDGQQLAAQQGGYGYVLGDEGSGASLGKILLQAFLYEQLSPPLIQHLREQHQLTRENILSTLYQNKNPSRYLAQYAQVVHQWLDQDEVLREHVKDNYRQLVKNCLQPLLEKSGEKTVHFVGSVAFHFHQIIQDTLTEAGITTGRIIQQPLPDLVRYHQQALYNVRLD